MSAAPYFDRSNSKSHRSRSDRKTKNHSTKKKLPSSRTVVKLDVAPVPKELRAMRFVEKLSTIFVSGLVCATLGLYAYAVYAPKIWSKEYKKLQKLQVNERGLLITNETLKNNLVKLSKSSASQGLVNVRPYQLVFLKSATVDSSNLDKQIIPFKSTNKNALDTNKTKEIKDSSDIPLSY